MTKHGECPWCKKEAELKPPYNIEYIQADRQDWICEDCIVKEGERQDEEKYAGGNDHCRETLLRAREMK